MANGCQYSTGGYFDDLASHGLDLFAYLLGDITEANGVSLNQQNHYSAKDAVAASWLHQSGIIGAATWNFGAYQREDEVRIVGSEGELCFSVFSEAPITYSTATYKKTFSIAHPNPIQYNHVKNMYTHLMGKGQHPSTGKSGVHTAWVMDKILETL